MSTISLKSIDNKLASALFGKTRRYLLLLLFNQVEQSFYLREVAREAGTGLGAVQRELAGLVQAGIVRRSVRGNQVLFQADPDCPVFAELRNLMAGMTGPKSEPVQERLPEQLL
ncbi:MAG TPA: winged helix-turn-helix domain-containing protein [Phycisphaerae bacterium]|nr:winged helix-turn-helix domain-containing protein [Phycisphaerae bacterium]HRY66491.1 winged helix-turn-helix domain-containing protein [Phycisphaerae bacterium]HSA30082.1 winged helix-turn-helix domain-containing protein [Phycisphaerae bacterium]